MEDRKTVLLRACLELLEKCDGGSYVVDALEQTIHYDDADCDGYCLMEDIHEVLKGMR